jgi:hypothetical protein
MKFSEWLEEMYTKRDIDAIGKHHADRAVKSNPDSKYHTVMRNRAARLRSLRDKSGPNAPQTKFKAGRQQMLKFAGEDSKTAKRLKEEGHIHLTAYDKHHPSGTMKKSFVAKASSDAEVEQKLTSIKNHVRQTGRTHRVLIHNTRTGEHSNRDIKHTNAFE